MSAVYLKPHATKSTKPCWHRRGATKQQLQRSVDADSQSTLECRVAICRGVAQPGSAPALGAGGPRFKSARPDHLLVNQLSFISAIFPNPPTWQRLRTIDLRASWRRLGVQSC